VEHLSSSEGTAPVPRAPIMQIIRIKALVLEAESAGDEVV
jgi:hypothetical protein